MSESNAVTAAVSDMVDAMNRGDFAAATGAFGATPVIVEDIAPFRWEGPDAPSAWLAAMAANAARLDVGAITMALSRPTRIEVNGAAAYAVFPGSLALMAPDGDLVSHGTLTFTLHGGSDRWLIETLVWSGAEPAPA